MRLVWAHWFTHLSPCCHWCSSVQRGQRPFWTGGERLGQRSRSRLGQAGEAARRALHRRLGSARYLQCLGRLAAPNPVPKATLGPSTCLEGPNAVWHPRCRAKRNQRCPGRGCAGWFRAFPSPANYCQPLLYPATSAPRPQRFSSTSQLQIWKLSYPEPLVLASYKRLPPSRLLLPSTPLSLSYKGAQSGRGWLPLLFQGRRLSRLSQCRHHYLTPPACQPCPTTPCLKFKFSPSTRHQALPLCCASAANACPSP